MADNEERRSPEPEMGELEFNSAKQRRNLGKKSDYYVPKGIVASILEPIGRIKAHKLAKGEDGDVISKSIDVATDVGVPLAIAGAGSLARGTETYKGAKLRHEADRTEYRSTDPHLVNYIEGKATNPTGQLSRDVYDLWGRNLKEDIADSLRKEVSYLSKKYDLSPNEINEIYKYLKKSGYEKGGGKLADDVYFGIKNILDKNISAQELVDKHVQLKDIPGSHKTEVDIPKTDKIVLKTPDALVGTGLALEGGTLLRKGLDAGGIEPSGLPSPSEFLNETGLGYSKRQLMIELNSLYDDIISNGNYQQRKKAREIMAATKGHNSNYRLKESLLEMKSILD